MFVQAPTALDRARGGLGLGLTLVRALVEMHGGSVSMPTGGAGQGSEFTVRLPEAGSPAHASETDGGMLRTPGDSRRKIVVVEDNGDIRETLEEVLTACGHEVETAADGPSGLSRLLDFSPDIALVDIGLPGFDGYELARAVRSNGRGDIVLVAMTGYGQPDDRARAFAAGFDEHLTKPVDFAELERVIERRPERQPASGR